MMRRGERSRHVQRVQQLLIELGYNLPRYGSDGSLGLETIAAMSLFMRDHGLDPSVHLDVIGEPELSLLETISARQAPGPPVIITKFHDRRSMSSRFHDYGRRDWGRVAGICLHQTACVLGEDPKRWGAVGCHVGVTRSGQVIWLHQFDRLIVHGNGWNAQCVGVELDGLYAGVEGMESSVWDDPDTKRREIGLQVTPELVQAAKSVIRWIHAIVARHGGMITALVAHRQSSQTRRNDPGEAIWRGVALPMHDELNLSDGGIGFEIGGRAIPEEWDPRCQGIPY